MSGIAESLGEVGPAARRIETEVIVVGGGIAGLTAATELATAHSASLCVWMPSATSAPSTACTSATAAATWAGSVAPLVSHMVTFDAPASAAVRRQRSAYSRSAA